MRKLIPDHGIYNRFQTTLAQSLDFLMAFTISHMVAAPLLYSLSKKNLPLASIAIGSITPDLPRLWGMDGHFSHTPTGLISIDLLIGLITCLLWYVFYRPICYWLCARQNPRLRLSSKLSFFLFSCLGILLGGFSHLLWDGLTHHDFRTWIAHDFLAQNLYFSWFSIEISMHRFLQYLTSFLALPFLYFLFLPIFQANKMSRHSVHFYASWLILLVGIGSGCVGLTAHYAELQTYLNNDFYQFIARSFSIFSQFFIICFTILVFFLRIAFSDNVEIVACDTIDK